ncbi:hypothetical protein [Flavobacterium sp.]|jgi:hypothetical protein|uniref:hypothetical protein n=1 Tax=Flavobacterium sp. TaxID=239 RepID=UPI0037C0D5AA
MGQYSTIRSQVFSVFGSDTWKAENIKTVPNNFIGLVGQTDYVRVTVIVSKSRFLNTRSNSGMLNIDIFTAAGMGPNASDVIADKLDNYLQYKTFQTGSDNVQFQGSSLAHIGLCPDNKSLHRSIYSIPFNFFGVL